jgi:hypothetical protein
MKKSTIYLVIALTLLSLSLTSILASNVSAQEENIKVLNYSYNIDYQNNLLIVYGEIQNVGSSTVMSVLLGGSVYSADGTDQADAGGQAYVIYIVPQQKVPFEIQFNAPKSSADGTWSSISVSRIDFRVSQATATNEYPYSDVKITSQSSSIDTTLTNKGTYWVTGTLKNMGTQTAQNIYVVATFYNASGITVSAGWSTQKVASLSPSGTSTFEVGAFDINMSQVLPQQKITSYSLIVRPGSPLPNGTAPAASEYGLIADSSNSQSGSQTNPTSSGSIGSNTAAPSYEWLIYAAIIIIIVGAVLITIKTFPKRKSAENKKTKPKSATGASPKAPSKKPQGKVRAI